MAQVWGWATVWEQALVLVLELERVLARAPEQGQVLEPVRAWRRQIVRRVTPLKPGMSKSLFLSSYPPPIFGTSIAKSDFC